jgi:predicted transcriptional regulator
MDSVQRDSREMTDEERIKWMVDLVRKLVVEGSHASDLCSLEAIRNPVRRNILKTLEERPLSLDEISQRLGITGSVLRYHLNFLAGSYFIQISGNEVDLTPGGVSVVRSYKRD